MWCSLSSCRMYISLCRFYRLWSWPRCDAAAQRYSSRRRSVEYTNKIIDYISIEFSLDQVDTYNTLCVTILSAHGEVQSEGIRVDNINVTCFRTSQSVDATVEWLIGAYLNSDTGVFAVNGDCERQQTQWDHPDSYPKALSPPNASTHHRSMCRFCRNWRPSESNCSQLDLQWCRMSRAKCAAVGSHQSPMEFLNI